MSLPQLVPHYKNGIRVARAGTDLRQALAATPAGFASLARERVRNKKMWKHVHEAADSHVNKVEFAVKRARKEARESLMMEELALGFLNKDHARVWNAVAPALGVLKKRLEEQMPQILMSVIGTSAGATMSLLLQNAPKAAAKKQSAPPKLSIKQKFDYVNPAAVDWAKEHAGELVADVADTDAINKIIVRAFEEGIPPKQAAGLIKSSIGLTDQQANAVANLRERILSSPGEDVQAGTRTIHVPSNGASDEFVDKVTDAYSDRLLADRAYTIARTETMRASNEGQKAAWSDAIADKLLTGNEYREWIVTDDDLLCPACEDMDGIVAALDESFVSPDGEEVDDPPLHPNCRCTIGISAGGGKDEFTEVPEESDFETSAGHRAAGGSGSGNFGHSGRPGEVGGSASEGFVGSNKFSAADRARIESLRVPPAWTNVRLNPNPHADLQVVGRDAKGREQYLYSAAHAEKAAAEKFERLGDFNKALPGIQNSIESDIDNKQLQGRDRESAEALYLISKTGFRVGSDAETGAKVKAYGATTLRAEHASVKGDVVTFDFIGKKGVAIHKEIEDKRLAKIIKERVKGGGRLFQTNDSSVRDYLHSRPDGENFKVKDFRTWHGTTRALIEINSRKAPATEKEFVKARKEVGRIVAAHLGNTPTVALASYINPSVFGKWKAKLGKGGNRAH